MGNDLATERFENIKKFQAYEARILALEEALKPFAEEEKAWVKMGNNYRPAAYCEAFTVGDLRRAARAYANKGEPT